jgi:DNA helicase-2/ATP-dependent DNA helicase PcrA
MNAARSLTPAHYQSRLGLSYSPSKYQAAIFDWIVNGTGNVVVDACAGSGKTETGVNAIRLADAATLAVAFNRDIADVLVVRLEGTGAKATTAHSHGLGAVRWYCFSRMGLNGAVAVEVDSKERKYLEMFEAAAQALAERREQWLLQAPADGEPDLREPVMLCGEPVSAEALAGLGGDDGFPVSECVELAKLARLFLLDFDGNGYERGLDVLARRYDVDVDAELWPIVVIAVRNALRRGCTVPSSGAWVIDYTDMLWLPNVLGLRPKQYDLVLVDECQDISTAARRLLIASVRRGGRMMFIGDKFQAINGFAGADADSFDAIIRETRAQVLPLSVCYRCPTSHLARARQWRRDIEARPGAPVGSIRTLDRIDYVDIAATGDLVICRRTAPLIGLCFELIAAGTSAMVRGRADMSKGLIKIIKRASKRLAGPEWMAVFADRLTGYEEAEATRLRAKSRDDSAAADAVDALHDRIECVRIIFRSSGAQSMADLTGAVERIFAEKNAAVTLSTVHRAKGLEADRVVILESDRLMSSRATQPWQIEQEENLAYVAWTRSKSEIIEILAPKRDRGER